MTDDLVSAHLRVRKEARKPPVVVLNGTDVSTQLTPEGLRLQAVEFMGHSRFLATLTFVVEELDMDVNTDLSDSEASA